MKYIGMCDFALRVKLQDSVYTRDSVHFAFSLCEFVYLITGMLFTNFIIDISLQF